MTRNERLATTIIEKFEDFLEARNVRIPTSDAEMKEQGEDPEQNTARIYGDDFGELQEDICGILASVLPDKEEL